LGAVSPNASKGDSDSDEGITKVSVTNIGRACSMNAPIKTVASFIFRAGRSSMARIDPNRVLPSDDTVVTTQSDEVALSTLRSIQSQPEELKPQLEIHSRDLGLVVKECGISQADAIDLIQKANGNIKEALRLYLHE
jgi:NACalpha-BTF3-like transcription factor